MREEEPVADDEAADERVGLEDPADPHRAGAGLGEADRDRRADGEVIGARGVGVDQQLAGGQGRGAPPVGDVQVDRLREPVGRRGGQAGERAAELELALVDGRDGRDPGQARDRGDHRAAEAARAADDVVGVDRAVDLVGGRGAQRGAEHGDRRHQRQADHQRRGGLGGPARVAHRVLAPQPSRHPEQGGQRPSEGARQRPRGERHQHAGGDEHGEGAHAHQPDGGAGQPGDDESDAGQGDDDAGRDPPPTQALRRLVAVIRERGDGRDAHGAARRDDRRDDRHADADGDRHHRGAGLEHQRRGGQRDPERLEQRLEPERGDHAEPETDQRRDQPGDGGLAEDRAEHLPAAGADEAQQRELTRALADGDRERVEDREGADEQRDGREDQQRRRDERQGVVDRGGELVGDRLAADDLDAGGQQPGDRPLQ